MNKTLNLCGRCRTFLQTFCHQNVPKRTSITGFLVDRKVEEDTIPINRYHGKNKTRRIRVYVCGFAHTGALGLPAVLPSEENTFTHGDISHPCRVYMGSARITHAACGHGFSLFASDTTGDQKLWGTGINTDSQIGFHKPNPKHTESKAKFCDYVYVPSQILLPLNQPKTKVLQVACGRAHSLVLTDKEGIFSMGNNSYGQCGRFIIDGEVTRASKVIHKIPSKYFNEEIVKIECGLDHSLFLSKTGKVYSCGWGADGQTGLGHYEKTDKPTLVKGDIDGVKIINVSTIADVNLALSENGEVFGWGNSEYHQLSSVTSEMQINSPTKLNFPMKVTQVAAGGCVCALLDDKGDVWVWGYGILGKGPKLAETALPEKIPPILFGRNVIDKDVEVVKIACGQSHFCAITNKGEIFTWGKNSHGCLGIRVKRDQFFPWKTPVFGDGFDVHCGVDHTVFRVRTFV